MKDYLSKMLYALTSAYSHKDYVNLQTKHCLETNIGKLFSILAWGFGFVKDQIELVKSWDDLDNARGIALDRHGANFGVRRMHPNDSYYRLAIKVKMMAQVSGGDINTVIWATASLLGVDPADVLLNEVYPAKLALYVDKKALSHDCLEMILLLADAVKRVVATGIGVRLILCTYHIYRHELSVRRFCVISSQSSGTSIIQNRTHRVPVRLHQGVICVSKLRKSSSNTETPHTKKRAGVQGIYCSTHIKPKRID